MTTATRVEGNGTQLRRFAVAAVAIAAAFGAGLTVDSVMSQSTERSQPRTYVADETTTVQVSDQEQMAAEIAILQAHRTNNTPTAPAELSDQEQMAAEIAVFLQARTDWN